MTAASVLLATMLVWQGRIDAVAENSVNPQVVEMEAQPTSGTRADSSYAINANSWQLAPRARDNYLGVRYIALTRGLDGAWTHEFQSANGNGQTQGDTDRKEPATAGELLDELLPKTGRLAPARS
jgi:hypothetical protein